MIIDNAFERGRDEQRLKARGLPPKRSRNIARVSHSRLGSESAVTTRTRDLLFG